MRKNPPPAFLVKEVVEAARGKGVLTEAALVCVGARRRVRSLRPQRRAHRRRTRRVELRSGLIAVLRQDRSCQGAVAAEPGVASCDSGR